MTTANPPCPAPRFDTECLGTSHSRSSSNSAFNSKTNAVEGVGFPPAAAPTLSGLGRGTPGGFHRFNPGELTFRDRLTPQPNGTAWGGVDAARAHGPGENLLRFDNPPARLAAASATRHRSWLQLRLHQPAFPAACERQYIFDRRFRARASDIWRNPIRR